MNRAEHKTKNIKICYQKFKTANIHLAPLQGWELLNIFYHRASPCARRLRPYRAKLLELMALVSIYKNQLI